MFEIWGKVSSSKSSSSSNALLCLEFLSSFIFREKAMNERDLACVLSKGINLNRISISADLLICFPSVSLSTQEVNSNYLAGGGGVEGGVTCTVRGVHPISHPSSANC